MKYNYNGLWKDLFLKTSDTLPIGTILPYGGVTAPANWIICDGSAISRTTYAELFEAIGTSFGEGDGSTTFNLPDLRGKVPVGLDGEDEDFDTIGETGGEKEHTLTIDEMPKHTHEMPKASGSDVYRYVASSGDRCAIGNVWTTLATGGNQAHNIMQPYIVVNYIIKAAQNIGVVGNVVNEQSISNKDTYSCNYVNRIGGTLRAYPSTTQSVIPNTTVKINVDTIKHKTTNLLSLSNGSIEIGEGVNTVLINARWTGSGASYSKYIYISKNGSADIEVFHMTPTNTVETTCVLPVEEGDSIDLKCYHTNSSNVPISGEPAQTFLQVTILN